MSESPVPLLPARALATPVPSPCNSICRIDPASGFCEGCWRTLDEIVAWSTLSDQEKRAVWTELERRRAAA